MSDQVAPTLKILHNETHEVVQGSNILLPCNFTTSGKLFKASWSRGNEKLTENFKLISNDSRLNIILQYDLKIENVQYGDRGGYFCDMFDKKGFILSSKGYKLHVFDSLEAIITNYTTIREDNTFLAPVVGVENETVIIPCQAIYYKFEEDKIQWQTGDYEIFSQIIPDARWPKLETRNKTIVGGFILEIQNVQFSDGAADFVCNIQDPETNESYGIFTHKLIVSNQTAETCFPSPCGLNTECRPITKYPFQLNYTLPWKYSSLPNISYTECACRPNFIGNPPNCTPVKQKNWVSQGACLTDNCKKICETFCGSNAKCVVKKFHYQCVCLDKYYGNPAYDCSKFDPSPDQLPDGRTESQSYEAYLHETVTLPCRVTMPHKSYLYESELRKYWKKIPGSFLFEHEIKLPQPRMQIYNQFNLKFSGAMFYSSGYYTCKMKGKAQNISYNLNIPIEVYNKKYLDFPTAKPPVEQFATTISAKDYEDLILPCEGMNLDFEDIIWEGYGTFPSLYNINSDLEEAEKNIPYKEVKMPVGYDLEIQNVQADDAGIYLCFMPLPGDSKKHFMVTYHELKVLDPPENQINPCKDHQCGENSECYVKNKNPVCSCIADKNEPLFDCKMITCMNEYCQKICNETCEFEINAACKIQNYKWTCACDDGFIRNPQNICVPDISETCGTECILLSVFTPILFFLLIVMAIFLRRKKKRLNRKRKHLIDDEILDSRPLNSSEKDHYKIYDEKLEFPRQRLFLEDAIGEGHYGRVLKAQASGLPGLGGTSTVAVKTLKKNATSYQLADLISEYQILKEFDHPNIIRLLGICSKDGPLFIIMEYAENGSLNSYLRRIKKKITTEQAEKPDGSDITPISPKKILNFAWQIAKGMSYLAQMKFVHRDLAARNVLVTKHLICKISDFGLSKDVYSSGIYTKSSKAEVPVKWMAIESLSEDEYTTKSDVWSFGIVLWELITYGNIPYPDLHNRDVLPFLKEGKRLEKPDDCSDEFYEIMVSCWKKNPAERPEFQDLIEKFDEMLSSNIYYLQCSGDDEDDKYVAAQ